MGSRTYLGVWQPKEQIILKLLDAISAISDLLHKRHSLLFELLLFLKIKDVSDFDRIKFISWLQQQMFFKCTLVKTPHSPSPVKMCNKFLDESLCNEFIHGRHHWYCMVKWLAMIHIGKWHAFRINVPNNWSSRPAFVTVKSTKVTLADNSGV